MDLLAFSSISSTRHQKQPLGNHQDYLQGEVLLREHTFQPYLVLSYSFSRELLQAIILAWAERWGMIQHPPV